MARPPTPRALRAVRGRLLEWYEREHRDFPWRATRDPYAVLVSEIMLQQTQASRVAQRFPRFMARFPTADALAAASPAEVLAEWAGLGYNRRALALQRAASAVVAGGWPHDVAELEGLPGVGPYTARALASLAFGRRAGVVDTNVRRWLVRRFGATDARRPLQSLADDLATARDDGAAAKWTHATMEFGAAICRARAPRCDACPIAVGCPSRGAAAVVRVPRQARLHGSDRAYRGAMVGALAEAEGHALRVRELRRRIADERIGPMLDEGRWHRILSALEADGLVHRDGGVVRLGAATIGA